jgi:hypothetical protein
MSATTTERSLTEKMVGDPLPATLAFPMKAATKVLKGTLVCLDAGFAKAATLATDLICEGRAKKTVDNTAGDDGDLFVEVEQGVFKWENDGDITDAEVGTDCYMTDNQTVQADGTGASRAGVVVKVEDDGVWVYTVVGPTAQSVLTVAKKTVTLTHGAITAAPDTDGTKFSVNVGTALPTNAVVIAHEVDVVTLFSGGGSSSATLDVGGTTDDAIVSNMDVFTGAATGKLSPRTGTHAQGKFSGQQLVCTLDADNATKTSEFTAGEVTITVWYVVLA